MQKKRTSKKKVTSAVAVVLAAVIALGGTFAWQSISQQARNEAETYKNPGGRLHDDFSGWYKTDHNGGVITKDIYVENFGSQPIYARVRLDEYMEIGEGAGLRDGETGYKDKDAPSMITGAEIGNPATWTTHIPGDPIAAGTETGFTDTGKTFHTYWTWTLGGEAEDNPEGQTIYMPTFNKNGDSLAADINGTMDGLNANAKVQYDDWVSYTEYIPEVKNADGTVTTPASGDSAVRVRDDDPSIPDGAFYDADDNTVDEGSGQGCGNGGVEKTNYSVVQETHYAAKTLPGAVCTMDQWKNKTDAQKTEHGWWVYDTDGWAYWSQPILPNTATGLLMDRLEPTQPLLDLNEDWYYGINAVGQFITADDLGYESGTGFFADGGMISDDALNLLESIGVDVAHGGVTVSEENGYTQSARGDTLTFSANISSAYKTARNGGVTWTISGNADDSTAIDGTGVLTIGANETMGNILTVRATSKVDTTLSGSYTVKVVPAVTRVTESVSTVTLDGKDYYVLYTDDENHRALVLSQYYQETQKFDSNCTGTDYTPYVYWDTSTLRTYLNATESGGWLASHPEAAAVAVETDIKTRSAYNADTWDTTSDKVFLLSEADVFGTLWQGGTTTSDANDYTIPGATTKIDASKVGGGWATALDGTSDCYAWWLRTVSGAISVSAVSPKNYSRATGVGEEGYNDVGVPSSDFGVRPALWIEISNNTSEPYAATKAALANGTADLTTVYKIDGHEWYMVAKDEANSRALLLSKYALTVNGADTMPFDTESQNWAASDLNAYLNGAWLDSTMEIKDQAVGVVHKTRQSYNSAEFDTTTEKIFLLSSADVCGQWHDGSGWVASDAEEFTYGGKILSVFDTGRDTGNAKRVAYEESDKTEAVAWWLRSPCGYDNFDVYVTVSNSYGRVEGRVAVGSLAVDGGVRPAFWYQYVSTADIKTGSASVKGTTVNMTVGGADASYTASFTAKDGTTVSGGSWTWTSSNTACATVTASGPENATVTVHAAAEGAATVTAAYKKDGETLAAVTFTVTARPVKVGDVITLDKVEFVVLDVDTDANTALLLSRYILEEQGFDNQNHGGGSDDYGDNVWRDSQLRNYLNSTADSVPVTSKEKEGETVNVTGWLKGKTQIQAAVKETTIYTATEIDNTTLIETKDNIFLLSQADVFGTYYVGEGKNAPVTDVKMYTVGKQLDVSSITALSGSWVGKHTDADGGAADWWWLRSPIYYVEGVSAVWTDGGCDGQYGCEYWGGVRPALIVDIAKLPSE